MRGVVPALAGLLLLASAGAEERSFAGLVKAFEAETAGRPAAYLESAERAWLAAERLAFPAKGAEGFAAGLEWDAEIQRLRAFYFRQVLAEYERLRAAGEIRSGRASLEAALRAEFLRHHRNYAKVRDKIRSLPDSVAKGPGRARFLGEVALLRGDTLEAMRILRDGWERFGLLDDFFLLASLAADPAGLIPDSLIGEAFRRKPLAPAVWNLAFDQAMKAGTAESFRRAQELSERALSGPWPHSVDWRIRHARAGIATGDKEAAQASLLQALRLLDEAPRLRQDSPGVIGMRREIFSLLEEARPRG